MVTPQQRRAVVTDACTRRALVPPLSCRPSPISAGVWDFVRDTTAEGPPFRIWTLVDDATRESWPHCLRPHTATEVPIWWMPCHGSKTRIDIRRKSQISQQT